MWPEVEKWPWESDATGSNQDSSQVWFWIIVTVINIVSWWWYIQRERRRNRGYR